MIGPLAPALRDEGLTDEAIARLDAWLDKHDLKVTYDHSKVLARRDAARVAQRQADAAAALNAAVAYTGPALTCQASVRVDDWSHRRCSRPAVLVVGIRADAYGDRLAVCKSHARTHPGRFLSRYGNAGATEPVG